MDSRNRPCSFAPKQKVKGKNNFVGTYGTDGQVREAAKYYLVDFSAYGPPPYPLSGKSFYQKTLSGNGGTPHPFTEK